MKPVFSCIALSVSIIWESPLPCHARPTPPDSRTLTPLSAATRVESYWVEGLGPEPDPQRRVLDGCSVLLRGEAQGAAFAHRLAAVLTDAQTYVGPPDKCIFDPGVVFRLRSGTDTLDALVCFHCDDIVVLTNGKPAASGHSSLMRPQLVWLAKEAFPGDKEIRTLKERPGP